MHINIFEFWGVWNIRQALFTIIFSNYYRDGKSSLWMNVVVRQNKSRKEKKEKKKPKNLTNWVGGLVIRFLFQRKSSILYLWGFNIMHVYTCIVSVDSYSGVRVSLIWLPPHSLTDVKMKNLHVCIFFFLCGEREHAGSSDKRCM